MFDKLIKFNMSKIIASIVNAILNRFKKVSRRFVFNEITQTKIFIIDYRFVYMNVKNVLNFVSIKIKNYYNAHY